MSNQKVNDSKAALGIWLCCIIGIAANIAFLYMFNHEFRNIVSHLSWWHQ